MKIVLDQKEIQELESLLLDLPYRYAQPVLGYLSSKIKLEGKDQEKVEEEDESEG